MPKLKMTQELADAIFHFESLDGLEIVDDSSWIVDGKYETKTIVFTYEDKHWMTFQIRSGSAFSDYNYKEPDKYAIEVAPKEITITTWEEVSEKETA